MAEASTGTIVKITPDGQTDVVHPPCAEDAGNWWCENCQVGLRHNMEASNHHESGHLIVWWCPEHGPEGPRS